MVSGQKFAMALSDRYFSKLLPVINSSPWVATMAGTVYRRRSSPVFIRTIILLNKYHFFKTVFTILSQLAMVLYAGAGKNSHTRQQLEKASVSFDV